MPTEHPRIQAVFDERSNQQTDRCLPDLLGFQWSGSWLAVYPSSASSKPNHCVFGAGRICAPLAIQHCRHIPLVMLRALRRSASQPFQHRPKRGYVNSCHTHKPHHQRCHVEQPLVNHCCVAHPFRLPTLPQHPITVPGNQIRILNRIINAVDDFPYRRRGHVGQHLSGVSARSQ